MKKIVIYFLMFIFICFILPALLTKNDIATSILDEANKEESKTNQENQENQAESDTQYTGYNYENYGTIKLLHAKTGEVEEVKLDEYLCNVVSAEMPADFELEALKAQAIVARTYTIYKIQNKKHDNADICDDSACCQAWISKEDRLNRWDENLRESNWAKIEQCVYGTAGKIITYNNQPINAFFHSNSGGTTELPVNVWGGGSDMPYLQVVETSGEDAYSQYASEVQLTQDELLAKLKEKYSDIQIDFNNDEDIKILEYTDSNRVKTVKFGNYEISGTEARSIFGLRSTNFEITKQDGNIKFTVKGYGHGVGMSQTGADSLAKQGSNCEDIIHHFYTDVEIKEVNDLN